MVFKIKMEDKAAFLNRMKDTIKSSQIKDNELEDYFEVISNNPKQIEDIELILKQSPKINTIKEMKNGLTRSELKEMVRQQLKATLAEKKKADDKNKEQLDEINLGGFDLNQLLNMTDRELGLFLVPLSWFLGIGGIMVKAAIADFKKKKAAGEIKSAEDVENILQNNTN
jgi:hypothetical protein